MKNSARGWPRNSGKPRTKEGATGILSYEKQNDSLYLPSILQVAFRDQFSNPQRGSSFLNVCVPLSLLTTTRSGISRGEKPQRPLSRCPHPPVSESLHGSPEVSSEVKIISWSCKFHLSNRKFFLIWEQNLAPNEALQDLTPQLLWLLPNRITLLAPNASVANLKSILFRFSNKCYC